MARKKPSIRRETVEVKIRFMYHLGVLLKEKAKPRSASAQCRFARAHLGLFDGRQAQ